MPAIDAAALRHDRIDVRNSNVRDVRIPDDAE
jgi:hypothetical protein